jgi:hypothetical protein
MRSAAVLLSTRRRAQRRTSRHVQRVRVRAPHRARTADASLATRPARVASRRSPSRSAKPRERIIHVVPRGFLPLVRH